jgi:cell wall-associated NlpC family hydrolase
MWENAPRRAARWAVTAAIVLSAPALPVRATSEATPRLIQLTTSAIPSTPARPLLKPMVPGADLTQAALSAAAMSQHLTRLELEIAAEVRAHMSDPRGSAPDNKSLTRSKVTSTQRLRAIAARVRSVAHDSVPHIGSESAENVVLRARRVVDALYPHLTVQVRPADFPPSHLAALLDAAATQHDQNAIAQESARAAELAAQRHILPETVPSPNLVEPIATPFALFRNSDRLNILLRRHDTFHQVVSRHLEVLATSVVAEFTEQYPDRPAPSTDTLVAAWLGAGHRRVQAVTNALAQVGKSYRFGSRGPGSYDCSGLTSYAWSNAGIALKTSSFSQREQITRLDAAPELRPGDLIFYDRPATGSRDRVGHVSMALGVGELIVEANASAETVRIGRYDPRPLWGFGRVKLVEERTRTLLVAPFEAALATPQ